MKTINLFRIIGLLGLLGLFGQVSASAAAKGPKTNVRAYPITESYHKLIITSAFEVIISDSVKQAMVTVPEAIHKAVIVQVDNGILRIAIQGKIKMKDRPRVIIPRNAALDDIELLGASSLTFDTLFSDDIHLYLTGASFMKGVVQSKLIALQLSGASRFLGRMFADRVNLDFSGASSAEIRGRVLIKLDFNMIEACHLDAEKLEVRRIEGLLTDASSASFWCTERMDIPVTKASRLVYTGRPLIVNCPTDGLSSVIHK